MASRLLAELVLFPCQRFPISLTPRRLPAAELIPLKPETPDVKDYLLLLSVCNSLLTTMSSGLFAELVCFHARGSRFHLLADDYLLLISVRNN